MQSFEWNKIIASVLTAMIVAMVSGILATYVVHPVSLENPVYMPPGAAEGAKGAEAAAAAAAKPVPLAPIDPALAQADPKKGQQIAHVCQQCHTFAKGEPNKIGPNLFGVFGGPIAEDRGGYEFSDALQKHKGKTWTPARLNIWLHGPQDFAQGTKMSFPGLPEVQERADVIAYLATLTAGGEATEKAIVQKAAAAAKQQAKPAAAKPAGAAAAKPAGAAAAKPAGAAAAKPASAAK
ncbi:MAG TPA: cytochrome c family protein [Stellaceae bacterium]|nr:cytochrome c family protein [Stellaceae bacterium]